MDHFEKLNPEQAIVVENIEGPFLVLAGPGTGKTQLLSVRCANIIKKKRSLPENILILTFTNSAAKAMKERLIKTVGVFGYDVEIGTFHSFANSVILESEEAANYIQEKIQITDIEKVKLLEYILDHTEGIDAIRPFRAPYIYRPVIEKKISELKKEGVTPGDFQQYVAGLKPDGIYVEEKHMPKLRALAVVYKLYEEYKNGKNKDIFDERGRYDFDDMIIFALLVLRNEQGLKASLTQQYKYIMVDEFQDTNGAQMELLFELTEGKNPNLCCVGDDDQSIYRFQGASLGNFRRLEDTFPGIKIIKLKDNYRSTQEIIELSGRIIGHLPKKERREKELEPRADYKEKSIEFHEFTTETEELLFVADKVKEAKAVIERAGELTPEERKTPYNNIAVLVRKRDDILRVIDAFLRAGIPYATDGKEDISSEKRVRQILDVLHLAHLKDTTDLSNKDTVFYRVITSDYLGIRMNDILRFINYVKLKRKACREKEGLAEGTLFSEFLNTFSSSSKKKEAAPSKKETKSLKIPKEILFEDAHAMHRAGWIIGRLLEESQIRPVHGILLQYINDAGLFKYILQAYADNEVLKIRDLRALSSFINMVKESDLNNPSITLADFIEEMETKKEHGIPLTGDLVTMTQEGVRIFTAHGSKGMEFHTVIIPFCIQNDNWPIRPRPDLIPLPPAFFKARADISDKAVLKDLNFYDETRLFYVASTRAKSSIIYTASPTESAVTSSYLANIGLRRADSREGGTEEAKMVKTLSKTGMSDPFIGTKAVLSDMVSNLTLNPTSLNNYITCRRKFLYDDVLMLPSEKKLSLTFGNCVHRALEDTYRHFMEKNKFPDFGFFKKSFRAELDYQGVEKALRLGCMRQLETLGRWFKNEARAPVKPIGLEKKLRIMLAPDLVFSGKYDKTEIADEKKNLVRVLDYKTGAPDDHVKRIASNKDGLGADSCDGYLRQLVAYKLLFDRDKDQNRGSRVSDGTLVFIEPAKADSEKYGLVKGEFVNMRVAVTDEMVQELEDVIKGVWKSINRLEFDKLPARDDSKCRNCDFDVICWG